MCASLVQIQRGRFKVARYDVARLMKRQKVWGILRGKTARTTLSNSKKRCLLDRVKDAIEGAHHRYVTSSRWRGFTGETKDSMGFYSAVRASVRRHMQMISPSLKC